jgi:hypothetical protein
MLYFQKQKIVFTVFGEERFLTFTVFGEERFLTMTKLPKYLFVFNESRSGVRPDIGVNAEVFASDMMEAQEKVCKLFGIHSIGQPVFVTENYDCPKCRILEDGDETT